MIATNGTDEGVLRAWVNQELEEWVRTFVHVLDEAIADLKEVCFSTAWDQMLAEGHSKDKAGATAIALYEEGLTDIFSFVRASGAVTEDVAWSTLKVGYRRASQDADAPAAMREALDDSLYAAEQIPLGNHDLYRSWARCLMLFLYQHAALGPEYPGRTAAEGDKLAWAYAALHDLEDHDHFHQAFTHYIDDPDVRSVVQAIVQEPLDDISQHQQQALDFRRFDLILNTGLTWLVGAVERD